MRSIIFDTGPIISLTTNNLLWILDELNKKFEGDFYVPHSVKKELIDVPLNSKRFKFEALQVLQGIRKSVFKVVEDERVQKKAFELLDIANHTFKVRGNWFKIVHLGEMEALAAAIILKSEAIVVDERITRLLVEEPLRLTQLLRKKIGANIEVNNDNLRRLRKETKNLKVLRSVELVLRAYELGILDSFLPNKTKAVPDPIETLLSSLLWGLKIRGCAIRRDEIKVAIDMEKEF